MDPNPYLRRPPCYWWDNKPRRPDPPPPDDPKVLEEWMAAWVKVGTSEDFKASDDDSKTEPK